MASSGSSWRPTPFLGASAGLHGAALAALWASPQTWPWVLTALLGNHLAIGTVGMFPRCGWLGANMTRLPAAAAGTSMVGLTFDDGPDPDVTPAVLEMLAQAGMKATFFCIGRRAEQHPDLITAIRTAGHGIENHSYSHPNSFALRGRRGMAREIRRGQSAIAESGGGAPRLFRAPAGIQNPLLQSALADAALSLVSWTRRGFDTVTRDGARVARRLTRRLAPGDILLLHDGSSAYDLCGRPVVLESLPRVLDELVKKGLRSDALQTLLDGDEAMPSLHSA